MQLLIGQFWPIKLNNGMYACGIVLDVPNKNRNRSSFFAGLLSWVGNEKPTETLFKDLAPEILERGFAHIKTISVNGEAIVGQIDLGSFISNLTPMVDTSEYGEYSNVINGYQILRKSKRIDHENLKVCGTWGYNVINILANKYLPVASRR